MKRKRGWRTSSPLFFQLEVIQLGDFRKNEVFRDLMLFLMQRLGSRLDIQRISKELGVSRPTLQDYEVHCGGHLIEL
jgi:predicted AAA+ superfamily ATPase